MTIAAAKGIALLGAPTSIGISPYSDGGARRLDLTPRALRQAGVVERLAATDHGDVVQEAPYRDLDRPDGRIRNEQDVAEYSSLLAARVADLAAAGRFVVILGGDCTILLGALAGLRRRVSAPGLVYVDAHADFASLEESPSGSACSMNLALAVGRHRDGPIARTGPFVEPERVVHVGRRDEDDREYGSAALMASRVADFPARAVRERGARAIGEEILGCVTADADAFWVHLDVDVLDPGLMPAVDSPLPGGLSVDEVCELLGPVVADPKAAGLQVTIYDPTLDRDGDGALVIVDLLARLLESGTARDVGSAL